MLTLQSVEILNSLNANDIYEYAVRRKMSEEGNTSFLKNELQQLLFETRLVQLLQNDTPEGKDFVQFAIHQIKFYLELMTQYNK